MLRALVFIPILLLSPPSWASDLVVVVNAERAGECRAVDVPGASDLDGAIALARLARCRFAEGDFDGAIDAVSRYERTATRWADRVDELSWAREVWARAALHRREYARAAALYRGLLSRGGSAPREERARLTYYAALAEEAAGEPSADDRHRAVVREFPGTRYATITQLHVDEQLEGPRALAMAGAALDGRHYEAAEELLTHAACGPAPCAPRVGARGDAVAYEAGYLLGHLLYRYRREFVERSLPWFETWIDVGGPRLADSRHGYAMAVMRMGRYDEARRALAVFADAHPDDARVDDALYRRAWLYLEEDRYAEAVGAFDDYLRGGGERVRDARWWVGWAHFRGGALEDAIETWATVDGAADRVTYWTAVAENALGRSTEATDAWESLNARAPLSFYGVLSARRLGRALIAEAGERTTAPDPDVPEDVAVQVARLGLVEEARLLATTADGRDSEFYRLRVDADPRDWVGWVARHRDVVGRVPETVDAARSYQLVVPRFHEPTVVQAAARASIPPELVWAIMRKESDFRADALSGSDAMGLMQVIPQTALAIADRREALYVDGMLFEPHHAIAYGTWYLGALREHFGGQLPLMIVGYNAGPLVVEDWLESNAGLPYDVFVEEIPFDQARDYVRRVTGFAIAYMVGGASADVLASPTLGGLIPERVDDEVHGIVDF